MINIKNTLGFYNKIYEPLMAKKYGNSSNRATPALRIFNEYAIKNDIKIKRAIDVGCRWGKSLKYWRSKGIKAIGVDVSKKVVKYCNKKGTKCYLASATDLSIFKDKQFDLYMATDVYEHLRTKDLGYAIKEAKRITKKYLLIRPHPALDKRGRKNIKEALHLTVWSLDKWQEFFEENGLNVIRVGENGEVTYKNVFLLSIN